MMCLSGLSFDTIAQSIRSPKWQKGKLLNEYKDWLYIKYDKANPTTSRTRIMTELSPPKNTRISIMNRTINREAKKWGLLFGYDDAWMASFPSINNTTPSHIFRKMFLAIVLLVPSYRHTFLSSISLM